MELAMTAFHSHLNPAVIFQQIDQLRISRIVTGDFASS
jgi:hypothetical protein